jgi:hypothetical protein
MRYFSPIPTIIRRLFGANVWLVPRSVWLGGGLMGVTAAQYRAYPETLLVRQVDVDARAANNRAERFAVVTTLLDPAVRGREVGGPSERRWTGELALRSLQVTMTMASLRCRTPGIVEKELWAHRPSYNLPRAVMARAAARAGIPPPGGELQGGQAARCGVRPEAGGSPAGRPGAAAVYKRLSRGKARKKQAIVAVARKLLVRLWAMLRDGVPWRPDPVPAAAA